MIEMKCYPSREAWLSARKSRIGGSDAAAILGLNPWKDNVTLWKEKTGRLKPEDISDKSVVRYGNDAEPLLRQMFRIDHPELNVYYREHNMWTNDTVTFAHASLDGWLLDRSGRKGIWECKTTEIQNSSQWDKWDNKIPDNYYCQILHYFMVTEFDFAVLTAQIKYHKDKELCKSTREYWIERSECLDDIQLISDKEKEFYKKIQDDVMPNMILPSI